MRYGASTAEEKKRKKRGLYITIGIHVLVVIALLLPIQFWMAEKEPVEEPEYVELNMAMLQAMDRDEGRSGTRSRKAGRKTPRPKPEPAPKTNPKPQTQQGPSSAIPVNKPVETIEAQNVPLTTHNPKPVPSAAPVPAPKPTATPKPASSPANGSGSQATGKPNSGGNNGNASATNNGKQGMASGQGISGTGLMGRRAVYRPAVKRPDAEGKVKVRVCVSRTGEVVEANAVRGSSTSHEGLIRMAEFYAKRYRYEADPKAPAKQCGYLTFVFSRKMQK